MKIVAALPRVNVKLKLPLLSVKVLLKVCEVSSAIYTGTLTKGQKKPSVLDGSNTTEPKIVTTVKSVKATEADHCCK